MRKIEGYNTEVLQKFEGRINDIIIDDQNTFYTTEWILDIINEKFGVVYNSEFILDLSITVEGLCREEYIKEDIESSFYKCICEAETFEEIQFDVEYKANDTEYMNEKIRDGLYLKK